MWERLLDPKVMMAIGAALAVLVNLVIDRVIGVPADSAPEWPAFVAAHPRCAGVVKICRALGQDGIKAVVGFIMALTGKAWLDPSLKSIRPPPPGGAP